MQWMPSIFSLVPPPSFSLCGWCWRLCLCSCVHACMPFMTANMKHDGSDFAVVVCNSDFVVTEISVLLPPSHAWAAHVKGNPVCYYPNSGCWAWHTEHELASYHYVLRLRPAYTWGARARMHAHSVLGHALGTHMIFKY